MTCNVHRASPGVRVSETTYSLGTASSFISVNRVTVLIGENAKGDFFTRRSSSSNDLKDKIATLKTT